MMIEMPLIDASRRDLTRGSKEDESVVALPTDPRAYKLQLGGRIYPWIVEHVFDTWSKSGWNCISAAFLQTQ